MSRRIAVLMVVIGMAIWPFGNFGKAQDGEAAVSSARALSERIDSLERKVERLERKISRLASRLESDSGTAKAKADGTPADAGGKAQGKGPCRGEWRQVGGGWVCYDPNAK